MCARARAYVRDCVCMACVFLSIHFVDEGMPWHAVLALVALSAAARRRVASCDFLSFSAVKQAEARRSLSAQKPRQVQSQKTRRRHTSRLSGKGL